MRRVREGAGAPASRNPDIPGRRLLVADTFFSGLVASIHLATAALRRNQQEQSDAAGDSEGRTVIEHGRMADPIPKKSSDDTGHELQQAHGGAVPAHPAGAQMLRHEIRCKRFADGAEYSLIQPVEDEQRGDQEDVLRQGKAEIGDQEDDKGGEQDIFHGTETRPRPLLTWVQRPDHPPRENALTRWLGDATG